MKSMNLDSKFRSTKFKLDLKLQDLRLLCLIYFAENLQKIQKLTVLKLLMKSTIVVVSHIFSVFSGE